LEEEEGASSASLLLQPSGDDCTPAQPESEEEEFVDDTDKAAAAALAAEPEPEPDEPAEAEDLLAVFTAPVLETEERPAPDDDLLCLSCLESSATHSALSPPSMRSYRLPLSMNSSTCDTQFRGGQF
jgi:hypothetical protein